MNYGIYYAVFGVLFVVGTLGYIVVTHALRGPMRVYEPRVTGLPAPSTAAPQA
jgi:hypothetical protein